jgi:hypothetical protein
MIQIKYKKIINTNIKIVQKVQIKINSYLINFLMKMRMPIKYLIQNMKIIIIVQKPIILKPLKIKLINLIIFINNHIILYINKIN